jgi:Coenzyme PQQ synthesis protein D (PqqD)
LKNPDLNLADQRLSLKTRLRRGRNILKQAAAGTVVLLNMDDGRYFALDGVGGRVWDLCDGSRTLSEIAAILGEEYDAPAETIERDLAELMSDLTHEDLVGENTQEMDGAPAAS